MIQYIFPERKSSIINSHSLVLQKNTNCIQQAILILGKKKVNFSFLKDNFPSLVLLAAFFFTSENLQFFYHCPYSEFTRRNFCLCNENLGLKRSVSSLKQTSSFIPHGPAQWQVLCVWGFSQLIPKKKYCRVRIWSVHQPSHFCQDTTSPSLFCALLNPMWK